MSDAQENRTPSASGSPRVSLRPGLRLLRHPSEGVVLADGDRLHRPDAQTATLLARLDAFDGLPRAADLLGPSPGPEMLQAWSRLRRTGVVVDAELPARMVRGLHASARLAVLSEVTALVGEDPARAENRWHRRRDSTVLVVGNGATSAGLVALLTSAGIDVTVGADGERRLPRPSLTVLAYDHEPPTDTIERLMRESLPHLAVGSRGIAGQVGPYVQPGATPCLRCVDLTRSHTAHGWAALREQLSGPARRGPGNAGAAACGWVTAATAALAAAEVVAVVDGLPPCTAGTTAVFRPGAPLPSLRPWPAHPLCGCTWQT